LLASQILKSCDSGTTFLPAFEKLSQALREVVELNVANFKADITWIRNDPSLFSQVERRVQNQVEVLHQWATVHESLLEKYRDEKSYTFLNSFARSESTAAVITALIALNANHNNIDGQAHSIISFSGLGKLDLLLN
jgi:hypothetical protein